MARLVEQTATVEIPRGSGVEGVVKVIREIYKLRRVQHIHHGLGKIEYTVLVPEEDSFVPLNVDFDSVMPHTVIRNHELFELEVPLDNAAMAFMHLFRRASLDRLVPIAFVGSSRSVVWEWHERTTGVALPVTDELYGLPFLADPAYEDATLFMCTSSERDAALIDTHRTYKILMPERRQEAR